MGLFSMLVTPQHSYNPRYPAVELILLVLLVSLISFPFGCRCLQLYGDSHIPNGGNATITWELEAGDSPLGMSSKDEVRAYCGEDVQTSGTLDEDDIDRWYIGDVLLGDSSTLPYNGTVNVGPFINMRVRCEVVFWVYNSSGQEEYKPVLPESAHSFVVGSGPNEPMQGHLAMTVDPSQVRLTWVSQPLSNCNPSVWYHKTSDPSNVTRVQAGASTYSAGDMCGDPAVKVNGKFFRDPGTIYTAAMAWLQPSTNYSYWYGTDNCTVNGTSPLQWFMSPKSTAGDATPAARIVGIADMGAWGGSNPPGAEWNSPIPIVMQRIVDLNNQKSIDLVGIFGDLSYANGQGYVWERYFYRLEPAAVRVPFDVAVGNHEYDYTGPPTQFHRDPSGLTHPYQPSWSNLGDGSSHGECAVPVDRRFSMAAPPGSNGVFWYSHNVANVHMVVISTEHELAPGSVQAQWLEQDLAAVNRTTQPWVVIAGHRSLYNNAKYTGGRKDSDLPYQIYGREWLTPLFARHRVNVYMSGHYHNYVRTCPLDVNGDCSKKGGTSYICVGTGGAGLEPDSFSTPSWLGFNLTGHHGFILFETTSDQSAEIHFIDADSGETLDRSVIAQYPHSPVQPSQSKTTTYIIVGAAVGGAVAVICAILVVRSLVRRKRRSLAFRTTQHQYLFGSSDEG